jgi:hypothetical protein
MYHCPLSSQGAGGSRPVKSEVVVSICALFISFLAFCVSVITILSGQHQKKIDNLISLHLFLHQGELSEARRYIREGGDQITLKNPLVRRVCSSFDFAGSLVRNGAVNKNMFFQYWSIPLSTLKRPLSQIAENTTGDNVKVDEYYKDFWWLLDRAQEYIHHTD